MVVAALSQAALDRNALLQSAKAVFDHNGSPEQRAAAFPEFVRDHAKLFRMICSGRCNLDHLELMLSRLADIESGSMTVEQASTVVANSLNATYIESVVKAPTPEQAAAPGQDTVFTVVQPGDEEAAKAFKRACVRP